MSPLDSLIATPFGSSSCPAALPGDPKDRSSTCPRWLSAVALEHSTSSAPAAASNAHRVRPRTRWPPPPRPLALAVLILSSPESLARSVFGALVLSSANPPVAATRAAAHRVRLRSQAPLHP